MKLGIVFGVVWSSKKAEELNGCRMYIVQPVSSSGDKTGNPLVVADPCTLAGPGDLVAYVTGTDAAQAFKNGMSPVNASIVELVEKII